jgi:hypothetical protein
MSLQTNFMNSIASKATQFDRGGAALQDQSSSTTTVKHESVSDPTATDLTLLCMKTNLLPLILMRSDGHQSEIPVKLRPLYWSLQNISNSRKKTSFQRYWAPSEYQFPHKARITLTSTQH